MQPAFTKQHTSSQQDTAFPVDGLNSMSSCKAAVWIQHLHCREWMQSPVTRILTKISHSRRHISHCSIHALCHGKLSTVHENGNLSIEGLLWKQSPVPSTWVHHEGSTGTGCSYCVPRFVTNGYFIPLKYCRNSRISLFHSKYFLYFCILIS